ncbi:MAG: phosphoribosylglycinamide formyltransferase [Clostridia bacterium]|nr:phosphoribosylglycinamide formyltransferase [Clostridia bacterium]
MLTIAVLVSGGGTNLQALLDAQRNGVLQSGQIALVISSQEDAYALTRARTAGIKTAVLVKERGESSKRYGQRLLAVLQTHRVELIVLAGFLLILDACVVDAYENRVINVHPSLIPSFCGKGYYGLKPHEAALERGVKITGATVHLVNNEPDGGRILAQKAVRVRKGDTPERLQKRVMRQAEWILLPAETEKLAYQLSQTRR